MNNYPISAPAQNLDFADRLVKETNEVKKLKTGLVDSANSYKTHYKTEISENTNRLKALIQDGKERGLSESDVLKNQLAFYPTENTPILNLLFFLRRENPGVDVIEMLMNPEERDNTQKALNEKYGSKQWDTKTEEIAKNVPEMEEIIYGNMTHTMFVKIKKLKALSNSPNEEEAFSAYTKCKQLCREYNLEFDKIPV
jgi:hypothetical protein